MNIAEKLKKLREEKGLSQQQLIDKLYKEQGEKIAISSIRNYENDKSPRVPQGTILLALSRFYDVSLEYLLDDNITAKSTKNISVSKELGLSDKTIENIKDINKQYRNMFDDFLLSADTYNFLFDFFAMYELDIIKRQLTTCYTSIKYDEKEDKIYTQKSCSINLIETLPFTGSIEYKERNVKYMIDLINKYRETFVVIKNYFSTFNSSTLLLLSQKNLFLYEKLGFIEDINSCIFLIDNQKELFKNIEIENKNKVIEKLKDGTVITINYLINSTVSLLNEKIKDILNKFDICISVVKSIVDEDYGFLKQFFCFSEERKKEVISFYKNLNPKKQK